jgi:serine/threonine protein kinase
MPLIPGQVLNNRYRIVKLLGQGGFGAVYRAWDANLKCIVAVKENLDTSPSSQNQFAREAAILYKLRHPNLPIVIDNFSITGQGQYLVMDYIEGEDLEELRQKSGGCLTEAQVLPWIMQVLDALEYMHEHKPPVIHRDIKPANIKINSEGKAMLVDFGVAKTFDPNMRTMTGARAVTPGYAPFEQYGQAPTDARSDIYALGATLYTLLTGEQPTESIARMAGTVLTAPSSLNPSITLETEQAILRAMEVQPSQRYQIAEDFKAALITPTQPKLIQMQPSGSLIPITQTPQLQPIFQQLSTNISSGTRHSPLRWYIWLALLLLVGALVVSTLIISSLVSDRNATRTAQAYLAQITNFQLSTHTPTYILTVTPSMGAGLSGKQYTVVSGDYLGKICDEFNITIAELLAANPNLPDPNRLEVGQILIIPYITDTPTATLPLPGDTTTPLAASPTSTQVIDNPQVLIDSIIGAGDLATEHVLLKNTGSGALSLAGWQLVEEGGLIYTFPPLNLFGGGAVNLFTKAGQDTVVELYWGLTMPVWQSGETAVLLDNQGKVRATYTVP